MTLFSNKSIDAFNIQCMHVYQGDPKKDSS